MYPKTGVENGGRRAARGVPMLCKKIRRVRLLVRAFFALALLFCPVYAFPVTAEAGSAVVQFSSPDTRVARGEIFSVICQVTSDAAFLDTFFIVEYDDSIMQFIKGGRNVSGGFGELQVKSTGNSEETLKKTFSLQFMAKGKGSGIVYLKGMAEVTDAEGNVFSVSSNRLSIEVSKNGGREEGEEGGVLPPGEAGSRPPAAETAKPKKKTAKSQKTPSAKNTPKPKKEQENAPGLENTPKPENAPGSENALEPENAPGLENAPEPENTLEPENTGPPAVEGAGTSGGSSSGGETSRYVLFGVIVLLVVLLLILLIVMLKMKIRMKELER